MRTVKSPLRYPGGKHKFAPYITRHLPKGLKEICSPFFGSGSLEIILAGRGIKVHGSDLFEPLVNFWKMELKDPKKLMDVVLEYYPMSSEKFYELREGYKDIKGKLERAAAFFVLNRTSFSGLTFSGGGSPEHISRFRPTLINRLTQIPTQTRKNITVKESDFATALEGHSMFCYLDPPYVLEERENNLYGNKGDLHKGFDHIRLFQLVCERDGWIMSYFDSEYIRELYQDFEIRVIEDGYTRMGKQRTQREILIFSNDLKLEKDYKNKTLF